MSRRIRLGATTLFNPSFSRLDPTSTHNQPLLANHKQCCKLFAEVVVSAICDGFEKGVYAGSVPIAGVVDREACIAPVKDLIPKPAVANLVPREPRKAAVPQATVEPESKTETDANAVTEGEPEQDVAKDAEGDAEGADKEVIDAVAEGHVGGEPEGQVEVVDQPGAAPTSPDRPASEAVDISSSPVRDTKLD